MADVIVEENLVVPSTDGYELRVDVARPPTHPFRPPPCCSCPAAVG